MKLNARVFLLPYILLIFPVLFTINLGELVKHNKSKNFVSHEIATVDINYVLSNSQAMQNLNTYIQEIEQKIEINRQDKKKIIIDLNDKLNRSRKSLSRKAFDMKKKQIIELSFDMQKDFEKQRLHLRKAIQKTSDHIFNILKNVIGNYAIDKSISAVLKVDPKYDILVLYYDAKLDISQNILEEFNKHDIDVKQLLKQFNNENIIIKAQLNLDQN